MARSTSQVKNRQQKFLDAIAQGHTILEAASSVGVSRSTIYNWREADPAFAKAWEFAYENGTDVYEKVAQDRAINGGVKTITDSDGKISTIVQTSDRMLELILRGRRPQVYSNAYFQHQYSGKVEVKHKLKTIEQARQRLLELGITPPTIEGEYEEVDASTSSSNITE